MVVSRPRPNNRVIDYVDRILVIEHDKCCSRVSLPLYANGAPTLLFTTSKGTIGRERANHITLFGQTVFPETLYLDGKFVLIAYFFKPYSLLSLFRVGPLCLKDNPTDMNLIVSKKTGTLQEQLLNARSVSEMIWCLDTFIVDLMKSSTPECALTRYATTSISAQPTKEALLTVQKELHITERTFQRIFEKNIGIPPNTYRRICQFNAAFVQLSNRNFSTLTDLAFQNGYADQSHYIRAFKEFTHITPTEYLNFGGGNK